MCSQSGGEHPGSTRETEADVRLKTYHPFTFSMGTKVLKDFLWKEHKGGKMDLQWLGPFEISADLGKSFYALGDIQSVEIVAKRINGAHLKNVMRDSQLSSDLSSCGDDSSPSSSSTSKLKPHGPACISSF